VSGIEERLLAVQASVEAALATARRSGPVTIVAVTKTVPPERIRAAFYAGQRVFGENRVQEALAKIEVLAADLPDARWHMIGHVQSNKARAVARAFSVVESVDSVKLARVLDGGSGRRLPVLLEVNVAGEATKHGFVVDKLEDALTEIRPLFHLEIRGLMTIAPLVSNPEDVRSVFRRLRELRDECRERFELDSLTELSMGMSGDFPVAIQEGATIVRVGRAIFGERPVVRG
jgi:pyridoxal phosphate enzyme (YggS family)